MKALSEIQKHLKAPKNNFNNFGKYKYRNCEDILEAVKPLLGEATLTLTDEIVLVGDRFYVKAMAKLSDGSEIESATAYAREPDEKKGMDASQITGTASSYARKYALNGLFCIDDTKDADSMNNTQTPETQKPKGELSKPEQDFLDAVCSKLKPPKGYIMDKIAVKACIMSASKNGFPTEKDRIPKVVLYLTSKRSDVIFIKDEIPFDGETENEDI